MSEIIADPHHNDPLTWPYHSQTHDAVVTCMRQNERKPQLPEPAEHDVYAVYLADLCDSAFYDDRPDGSQALEQIIRSAEQKLSGQYEELAPEYAQDLRVIIAVCRDRITILEEGIQAPDQVTPAERARFAAITAHQTESTETFTSSLGDWYHSAATSSPASVAVRQFFQSKK